MDVRNGARHIPASGRIVIRCPLCAAMVRELAKGHNPPLETADRIIARATFEDWTGRYEHLVTEHNWVPKPRTADDGS